MGVGVIALNERGLVVASMCTTILLLPIHP
jgi:hypothetical protein